MYKNILIKEKQRINKTPMQRIRTKKETINAMMYEKN
jgi:hypothetical protein